MIFAAFTAATILILALNTYCAWRDFIRFGDLLIAAQLLTVILGYSVIFHDEGRPWKPDDMIWLVPADFVGVLVAHFLYITKSYKWSFALVLTYMAQLGVHAWFWGLSDKQYHAQYLYVLLLNSLAVLQLPIVGGPGVRYVAGEAGTFLLRRGAGSLGVSPGAVP